MEVVRLKYACELKSWICKNIKGFGENFILQHVEQAAYIKKLFFYLI